MKKGLLFLLFLVAATKGMSQLTSNYPPTNGVVSTGTYVDLGTNGTVITTANNDDALSAAQPIGFNFTFNGTTYTDFILSTNGFIKLGTTAPSTSVLCYTVPQASAPPVGGLFNSTNALDVNIIAPFCIDLTGATGCEYRVYTTGTVGSRVCTIQWKNVTEKTSTVATQYSNFQFQVKLYEGSNIIDIVYGAATSSTNTSSFKSAIVGLKGTSTASNQIVSITKGSTQAWNLATFAAGNYTGNSFNYGNSVGAARPLPVPGTTYTFVPVYANDLAVLAIYTLGKLPKQYVSPQYIRARIKNPGTALQANFKVYLQVRGANTFDDSVSVASLAVNGELTVSFQGYTSINNGLDTITVFVAGDNNNLNNSKSNTQLVNDVIYSYADPNIPAAGGIGFTGNTGQFCAKFPYSGVPNSINQVGVNFFGGGIPLQIGIWDKNATNGGPGTLLWSSSQFTSVTGLNTIPVNPAVSISDTFFVGVIQPTTNNANFAYQAEIPVRDKTFFYGALNTTSWSDFATAGSNFRFMIEPRFQSPNDMGVTSIDYPCQIVPLGQSALYPFATVFNYGLLSQNNVPVNCAIYLNGTQVYSSSTTTSTVSSGTSQQVNFPTLFSPASAGLYVIRTWTDLPGDASAGNDTASSTLQIVDYNAVSNAGIRVQLDGVDDYMTITNVPVLNPASSFTIEGWFNPTSLGTTRALVSKDSNATTTSYNLSINSTGNISFTVNTTNGIATATSTTALSAGNWYHIAATYDGTDIKIYLNGTLTGSTAQSGFIISNGGPLYLGRTGGATPNYYSGGIEEFRFWTTPRTANEIRSNIHSRIAVFSDPNLVCYLRFDEGTGTYYTADGSGNCNHGTLVNMDINNTSASPVWYISTVPLGAPVVTMQTVTASGAVSFIPAHLSMNFSGYSGAEDYYVHMFNAAPTGTQPTTTPGGITDVHPRTWLIYRYGTGTFTSADATFELINNTLLPTAVNSDIKLFSRSNGAGTGWTLNQNAATSLNITPPTATFSFSNTAAFNQQFVIGGNNNPLPVKLISFNAKASDKNAVLTWQTSSEENTEKFIIEKSLDGKTFEPIGTQKGLANHTALNNYVFVDQNAGVGHDKVFYRLQMADFDGRTNFSPTSLVRFGFGNLALVVQPNPFHDNIALSYQALNDETAFITITDIQGKTIYVQPWTLKTGINDFNIDLKAYASGLYILQLKTASSMIKQKIVKD